MFCINPLGDGDQEIAAIIAGSTELTLQRRFERGTWRHLATGSPLLESAIAAFDCRLVDIRRVATHDVVVGEVLAVRCARDAAALAYLDRGYRTVT